MADILEKQPAESRLYDMDFSPKMSEGETITSVVSVTEQTVAVDDSLTTTSDLTFGTPAFSGQAAQVRISVGLVDVQYKVTFLVTTSLNNTLEAEGLLNVINT